MLTKRPLPYSDFQHQLETFDLILMQGILATSQEAKELTSSQWSHVGMIVVAKDIAKYTGIQFSADLDAETRLLWEANTPDGVNDVLANRPKSGPQLTKLVDRIDNNYKVGYDGLFAARKLLPPRTPDLFEQLGQIILDTHPGDLPALPEKSRAEAMLASFLVGRFSNESFQKDPMDAKTYFCSQLVAHTYMQLGLMTKYYVDNSYAPADFTQELDVTLLNGAWLGQEILLANETILHSPNPV